LTSAFLLLHPADGRVFFVIPWLGKTLIGTTDTHWEQSPDALMVTDADIDYTLAGHNHYFTPPLERRDILNSFAGLRPLIHTRSGEPSSLSREFQLFWSPSGLLSVAGGKYTTYRRMAEIVTDAVARRLQHRRRSRTRNFRLHGAPGEAWEKFEPRAVSALCSRHGLDDKSARHLVGRYGQCAQDVAAYFERDRALAERILPGEPDLRAEFPYQRDREMAIYPVDHLLRRTRLGLFRPELLSMSWPIFAS
jgi:glycerol-3-phosphate dehydrogenase